MNRKERFERLFETLDREELKDSIPKMCSAMMDMGFDERDVNMAWYLGKTSPQILSDAIAGKMADLDRTSDVVSAKTMLDREKLKSFLGDISRSGFDVPEIPLDRIGEGMESDAGRIRDACAGQRRASDESAIHHRAKIVGEEDLGHFGASLERLAAYAYHPVGNRHGTGNAVWGTDDLEWTSRAENPVREGPVERILGTNSDVRERRASFESSESNLSDTGRKDEVVHARTAEERPVTDLADGRGKDDRPDVLLPRERQGRDRSDMEP